MRTAAVLIASIAAGVVCLVATTQSALGGGPATDASGLRVTSELPEYQFVKLRTLPRSPESARPDEYCSGYRAKRLSSVAYGVEKLGWIVTSEAPLGRFKVITFTSGFDPGTSALCFTHNANIAVFERDAVVALAYAKRPYRGPNSNSKPSPLGVVEPLADKSGLLVWTDPPGSPVGELHADGESIRLVARAHEHTYCNGRTKVPDLYERGIDAARRVLLSQGWVPERPADPPGEGDMARDMAAKGLIEAETCSGTGVGYCAWNYRSEEALLHVATVGGEPEPADNTVVSYNVECRPR